MTRKRRRQTRRRTSSLQKRAQRGFRGYPIATVAYYGPDDKFASKVAVGIVPGQGEEVASLKRWFADEQDVRVDPAINQEIVTFIEQHGARSVGMADRIIGCPHEEGIDYPLGQDCPQCPYWAGRDRWTGERIGAGDALVPPVRTVTGYAWYRAEQWDRLREISVDRDELQERYEDWLAYAESAVEEMRQEGMHAEKIEVDVDELLAWCQAEGLEENGQARAQYAAEAMRQRYESQGLETGQ